MFAAELGFQPLEPIDALGDPVARLAPEELDIGIGGRDLLGGGGRAAEVEQPGGS